MNAFFYVLIYFKEDFIEQITRYLFFFISKKKLSIYAWLAKQKEQ